MKAQLRKAVFILCFFSITIAASRALADDLFPPPWRGQPGSTFALWEYLNPSPQPLPDVFMNPFGPPMTQVTPGFGQVWQPTWGGKEGVWPLSGTISIDIPNYPVPNPYKDVWVQLTWASQAPGNVPVVWETLSGAHSAPPINHILGPTGEPIGNGVWVHSIFQIRLFPNPQHEIIRIDGGIMVDELVIDTICVPEPGVLALLILGGAALVWRRR